MGRKIVGVTDVLFNGGRVAIACEDGRVYPAHMRVANALRQYSAVELQQVLGTGAVIEPSRSERNSPLVLIVVAFAGPETISAILPDANSAAELQQAEVLGADPARGATDSAYEDALEARGRVKVERYGLAVAVDDEGRLFAHSINRFGAIQPEGTLVTRPSPAFLAAVNEALGSRFTLSDFPEGVVRGA